MGVMQHPRASQVLSQTLSSLPPLRFGEVGLLLLRLGGCGASTAVTSHDVHSLVRWGCPVHPEPGALTMLVYATEAVLVEKLRILHSFVYF